MLITIEDIVQTVPLLKNKSWHIDVLNGWSNKTYLLTCDAESYVVRIPLVEPKPWMTWINREREYQHIESIQSYQLTPDTLYFDIKSGICIRQYIPGTVISDDPTQISDIDLTNMAMALKKLHQCPVKFESIHLFDTLKRDMGIVRNGFDSLDARYRELNIFSEKVSNHLGSMNNYCCHMDPNPHNFLKTAETVMLLDFEYAAGCDNAWDLAYTITYSNLSPDQTEHFLHAYGVSESERYRITLYKPLTQWMQAIWIRLQFLLNNYPVSREEMEQWEQNALSKACVMMNDCTPFDNNQDNGRNTR